ncbi:AAA family ATPase [Belnapia sp. T18]|uniref:AAA family ATPase n=1 Tax=Belnapia arida TaxID=2804533 RepID=A0ABS1UDA7_9PROT|nr:AAA family ATPase [Belnapia arida]MBL6081667.1 AAA family ATPase [Belnapia arida]
MHQHERFFVITGGPGSGKSTLIKALVARGLHGMPEAGRAIIQDQVAIGGSALPWDDRLGFAELMLGWELRSHREARERAGPVFFDRGVPDVVGYLTLCSLAVPSHVQRAAGAFRYNRQVFIAPPWPEIFGQDAERKQSPDEAQATYEAMVGTYSEYGYELTHLPHTSVEERTRFILARIQ